MTHTQHPQEEHEVATLADVARIAGVSKSTASRALSHTGPVAPGTLARIEATAEQLGFIPNRAAAALAGGRVGLVAVVLPSLENSYFTPVVGGAQATARDSGLLLTVAVQTLDSPADEEAIRRLAGEVDGFLLIASQGQESLIREVARLRPVVLIDREIDGIASVVIDTEPAFTQVVDQLIAAGRRRIALVGGPQGSWHNRRRIEILSRAIGSRAELVILGPFDPTIQAGALAADEVLAAGVDAVIPYARSVAIGLGMGLKLRGVRMPDDVVLSIEAEDARILGIESSWCVTSDQTVLGALAMTQLVEILDDGTVERSARRAPIAVVEAPARRLA